MRRYPSAPLGQTRFCGLLPHADADNAHCNTSPPPNPLPTSSAKQKGDRTPRTPYAANPNCSAGPSLPLPTIPKNAPT